MYVKSEIDKIQQSIFRLDQNPKLEENLDRPVISVISMATGFGKTHAWHSIGIPELRKRGANLFFYLGPQKENVTREKSMRILNQYASNIRGNGKGIGFVLLSGENEEGRKEITYENLSAIRQDYEHEMPIFINCTLALFRQRAAELLKFIEEHQSYQVVVMADEIHFGSATNMDAVEAATGVRPPKYAAALWNQTFLPLLEKGYNRLFGMTATCTPQIRDEWKDENGNDLYLVVNDWVKPELAVTRTKHMEGLNFYPNTEEGKIEALNKTFQQRRLTRGEWLTTKDYWLEDPEHKNNLAIWDAIGDTDGVRKHTVPKIMIKCETAHGGDEKLTLKRTRQLLAREQMLRPDELYVSTCGEEGWALFNSDGGRLMAWNKKDDGWLDQINNNDRCVALLVIQKGVMGCDYPALMYGIVLNEPKAKNDDGYITKTPIQLFGRFSRPNLAGLDYDETLQLPNRLQEDIWKMNRYSFELPDTPSYRAAIVEWVEKYAVVIGCDKHVLRKAEIKTK